MHGLNILLIKTGEVEIFNTEVIYSRAMCLLCIGRIELEEVLFIYIHL